jgi:hypothetical protein
MTKIAFIAHTVLEAGCNVNFSKVREQLMAETGATSVEYHRFNGSCTCDNHHPIRDRGNTTHIVLTNPKMSFSEIKHRYADCIPMLPVWGWDV